MNQWKCNHRRTYKKNRRCKYFFVLVVLLFTGCHAASSSSPMTYQMFMAHEKTKEVATVTSEQTFATWTPVTVDYNNDGKDELMLVGADDVGRTHILFFEHGKKPQLVLMASPIPVPLSYHSSTFDQGVFQVSLSQKDGDATISAQYIFHIEQEQLVEGLYFTSLKAKKKEGEMNLVIDKNYQMTFFSGWDNFAVRHFENLYSGNSDGLRIGGITQSYQCTWQGDRYQISPLSRDVVTEEESGNMPDEKAISFSDLRAGDTVGLFKVTQLLKNQTSWSAVENYLSADVLLSIGFLFGNQVVLKGEANAVVEITGASATGGDLLEVHVLSMEGMVSDELLGIPFQFTGRHSGDLNLMNQLKEAGCLAEVLAGQTVMANAVIGGYQYEWKKGEEAPLDQVHIKSITIIK